MSKVFSPFTVGVGFTAMLALAPGLGIGPKTPPPAAAAKGELPVDAEGKTPRAEGADALLKQCLEDRPRVGEATLGATILTLPDPQRTRMGFWFDLRLHAVQRAFKDCGFLPRAYFLPWEAKAKEASAPGRSSEFPDASPGLIWFARERAPGEPPGAPTAYHALFIVGESQLIGINRKAMASALSLAGKMLGSPGERPVTILGPQFSGSLTSLGAALEVHLRAPAAPSIRIQGTTTLDSRSAEALRTMAGGVAPPRLTVSSWLCNLSGSAKNDLLRWYIREADWPEPTTKVAVFTESNTVYGVGTTQGDRIATVLFPMGLSRLRAERHAMERGIAKGDEAMELVLPSTLLGPSEDDATRGMDTLPQFASDTIRNAELTLAGTIVSLARRVYTHIGISASDPQDLIFLAERIRAYHPSCTLFTTSGNHLLFAHPNFSSAMDGMVLFGGYPLTDPMRAISLKDKDLESPVRFTSEGEYAAYYAALLALDPARAEASDRRFWGKQGLVSMVKSGNIWPLRHGGVEVSAGGATHWERSLDAEYLKAAQASPDLARYALSRLQQLSLLLVLLGGATWWCFLRPLDEVRGVAAPVSGLRSYLNLVAGSVLAVAVLALLAVGYLLPLAVLLKVPRGNLTFLYVNLLLLAGFLVLAVRALQGWLGWGRTALLLGLALLPAVGVGLWGRAHFLTFMPGYLRFTSPGRGVSILPAFLALASALALILRTRFDVRRQGHAALWPGPLGLSEVHGLPLRHLRGLRFQTWIYLSVGVLLAFHWMLQGGVIRTLMEVQAVAALAVAAGGCIFISSLALFWQLHRGWRELGRILDELNVCSYRAAFKVAGTLMEWNAMRALGRGLETHRSSRRGRELLEAQEDWAGAAVPALGEGLATLRREEAKVPPSRDSLNGYARWQFRLRVAGLMTLCGEHLQTAVGLRPEEAVSHREDLDLFSALRAVIFLRQAFLVSRHLLVGSLGSLLLLLFGLAALDFQPKVDAIAVLGTVLLVMAGWVTLRIIQVERDPLLCLMEGTDPTKVQLSLGLVENGIRFVLVPLVLLLATFSPALGGLLTQVFNPLLHLLK